MHFSILRNSNGYRSSINRVGLTCEQLESRQLMASDLQALTNVQDVSSPTYSQQLTTSLEDQLAQAPATHAYHVDGQAKPMIVQPSKLALKLADGVSDTDLASLGIEFDRKLTDDFSVYKTTNASPINRQELTNSGLVEDAVSVFFVQGSRSEAVVFDEVIVSLKPGVTESEYFTGNELFSSHRPVQGTPNQFVARVADGLGEVALHVANSIDEDPRLEFTAPNFYQSWQKYFTPNDPRFANQWYLNNTGQGGGLVDADPDVAEAWDTTKGSSTVVVGVIDDGISSHSDQPDSQLWKNPGELLPDGLDSDGNGWVDENNGWNFVNNNEQTDNSTSADRHGTAIAGIIGARGENGVGIAGVAYQSKVLSSKMAENGVATNDANIASAFYYAAGRTADGLGTWKASDVIVWAWGGGSGAAVINAAMTWATTNGNLGKGVAIFVGTGNNNGAVTEPALQSLTNPGVIAVGAYNNKGLRSDYSNFGPALDVMAPSNDGRVGYQAIDTTDRQGADGYDTSPSPTGDYTGTANLAGWGAGTSTAAAVAAGIGALTLTRSIALGITPALTATQLKSYLRANTDYIGGQFAPYDIVTGKATEYGFGGINANSAVTNLNKPEISVMTTTSEVQSGGTVVVGQAQFGANVDRVIRIRNQGTQTLNLTSLNVASGPFSIVTAPGSTALALGESTTFTVRFSPTGGGVQTRVLTINSNDTSEAAFAITLSGTGPNVTGKVFEDFDGDSIFDTPDVIKSNHIVWVDDNDNGVRDSATTTFTNTTATPIPDGTTITSTIAVAGLTSVVRDLNVRVSLTHPANAQLMLTLISPNGTRVMLANRNGAGANFTNTVFDDEAATLISAGTAPLTGSFRPLQPLSAFDDAIGNGTWTLEVADQYTPNAGTLVSWDLIIGTAETVVSTAADGSYGLFNLPIGASKLRHEVPVGWSLANPAGVTVNIATANDNLQDRHFGIGKNDRFYAAVFDDYNVNGLWDNGEVAVSPRVIFDDLNSNSINDGGGETNLNMVANGYGFLDLPAGAHNMVLDTFAGWRYTLPANGTRTVNVVGTPLFDQRFGTRVNNRAPTDIAFSPSVIPENSPSNTAIGTITTTDPDFGDTFTYALVAGTGDTDNALFTIDPSGVLKSAAAFNFEVTPTFSIRVRTTDQDGLFFEKTLTVTVTNVNETPTDVALSANAIAENSATGSTVGSFSSTDVDAGDTFTYTLVSGTGSTDNAQFTIDGSGNLKTAAPFNFEATPSFSIRVRTTDAGGLFFEKPFTVTVNDVNEAPSDIALSANMIAENLASGTTVGSFSSTDQDAANTFTYTLVAGTGSTDNAQFTIDGSGNLKTAAAFDFEATPTFSVRVRTTDQGGLFFEKAFTINVTNANETPTDIALSANTIVENSASGTTVGSFSSTDPDAGSTFAYTLVAGAGGTDNAQFTIDGSGNLVSAGSINFEATPTLSVRVRTTDQGGLFFEKIFTINVTNANETPTDIAITSSTIPENSASGTTVGSFSSTDPDAGNTFTYTLVSGTGSTDNGQFSIDGSGALKSNALFDFESTPSFSIRVRTTDQGGLFVEKPFTITVVNVNETPTDIGLSANTIAENAASGTTIGSFSSADPDAGNTFAYTLVAGTGSTDNAQFTIDGSGNLKSAGPFNFEATPTMSVRVRSTDQGGLFFEKIFTITVTNANETPTDIALSSSTIQENLASGTTVGSFTSTDPDAGNTFTYTLVAGTGSTNNALFTIDGSGNLKTAAAFNFETTPTLSIRVRSTDQGGLFAEKVFTITVTNALEMVGNVVIGTGTAQRSLVNQLVLTFDGIITLDPGAFVVNKRGVGGGAVTTNVATTTSGGQTIVTLTFSGPFTRGASNALVDGYYDLTADGSKIHSGTQTVDFNGDGVGGDTYVLGAAEADNFFALYGDTNGDGLVGVAEFGQFRNAFGKTSAQPGYDPLFDYESDNTIGVSDFGQFRSRFGKPKLAFT